MERDSKITLHANTYIYIYMEKVSFVFLRIYLKVARKTLITVILK